MSDEKVISGEEHRARQHASTGQSKQVTIQTRSISTVAVAVVLCALSFWGGVAYQKHHTPAVAVAANTSGGSGGRGFGGTRRGGGLGQVTAVSSTSITITNQRTNVSQTYTINSSTTISDNGQTAALSNIQAGDTVLIMTSGSGSTTATRILVNPSFGGGFGGTSAPGAPSSTSPTQTN